MEETDRVRFKLNTVNTIKAASQANLGLTSIGHACAGTIHKPPTITQVLRVCVCM